MCLAALLDDSRRALEAQGVTCRLKAYPGMRHVYPPDFDAALGEALNFILSD